MSQVTMSQRLKVEIGLKASGKRTSRAPSVRSGSGFRRRYYKAPTRASTIKIANPTTMIITSPDMCRFADSVMAKTLH
jgi:hypothetical protein